MKTYALESGIPPLAALVDEVKSGEEIVLTDHAQPVAKLVGVGAEDLRPPPEFGVFKGLIEMAPDFDEPLEDFREYME